MEQRYTALMVQRNTLLMVLINLLLSTRLVFTLRTAVRPKTYTHDPLGAQQNALNPFGF